MERGKLIVLEGINGCGKGAQLFSLARYIYESDKSKLVFVTREPNILDENGMLARGMLKRDGDPYSNGLEAVRYFAENRKSHNELFLPLIERGVDVLTDRYWHSNFAFQHAQGVSYQEIANTNKGSLVSDLTLILDVPSRVAFERLRRRDGDERRKFDSDISFLDSVRSNYLELPDVLSNLIGEENVVLVDASGSIERVASSIETIYDASLRIL